jgi:hypothetical protein
LEVKLTPVDGLYLDKPLVILAFMVIDASPPIVRANNASVTVKADSSPPMERHPSLHD